MPDYSNLFVSEFWSWFIIVPTILGILGCFGLIFWLGSGAPAKKDSDGNAETMGHTWDGDLQEYNNPLPKWWLNMFYITLVFGLVYLALYPGLGSFEGLLKETQYTQYKTEMDSAESTYGPMFEQHKNTPIEELVKNPKAVKMGERLFMTYCTVCHGSDAKGSTGYPNLRDDDWLFGSDPKTIEEVISKGKTAVGMMPWGAAVGGDEGVKAVAEYVLSLSNRKDVNAELAAQGKEKFAICSGCHGVDGKGMAALGAPNLTDDIWLYGGKREAVIESIAKGRAGVMPAHGEFLGDAKVHLLTAYVYSLSNSSK
jgi:cytochrome c oxidase cbb3-type subunit III